MGSRAVVLVCRDAEVAARTVRRDRRRDRRASTPAPGGRSSRPAADRGAARPAPRGGRRRRPVGRAGHRLAAARRRAAAVVGQGRGPAARPVRRGRRRRPRARCRPPVGALDAAVARGVDVADLLARTSARAANADAFTDGVPALLLADRRAGRRPARAVPGAGRRGRDLRPTATTAGTSRSPTGSSAAAPDLIRTTRRAGRRHRRPRSVAAGGRLVGGADRRRRRGHGGQAVREPRRTAGEGCVQPGIKVRGREYLRIIYGPDYTEPANLPGCATATSATSGRWPREYALGIESLERTVSASRCGGSTNRSSPSSPWNPSRSTRGCETTKAISVRPTTSDICSSSCNGPLERQSSGRLVRDNCDRTGVDKVAHGRAGQPGCHGARKGVPVRRGVTRQQLRRVWTWDRRDGAAGGHAGDAGGSWFGRSGRRWIAGDRA